MPNLERTLIVLEVDDGRPIPVSEQTVTQAAERAAHRVAWGVQKYNVVRYALEDLDPAFGAAVTSFGDAEYEDDITTARIPTDPFTSRVRTYRIPLAIVSDRPEYDRELTDNDVRIPYEPKNIEPHLISWLLRLQASNSANR